MMKEEIDEFVKRNGNIKFTIKELIQSLHMKIEKNFDMITEKFESHCAESREDISKMNSTITRHDVLIGLLYVIMIGLLIKVLAVHF